MVTIISKEQLDALNKAEIVTIEVGGICINLANETWANIQEEYLSNKLKEIKNNSFCAKCKHKDESKDISGETCYACVNNPVDHRIDWFEEGDGNDTNNDKLIRYCVRCKHKNDYINICRACIDNSCFEDNRN